ncbi:hypothetical protein [Rhizomonospora bruguierae]|uniref:hypothetical protein n=1 Tax=Rhizomonospora bruguierae TaxID=1581705 RepID=UPI001BCE1337|nr:hypothetical protein [Micromonospora sp. NBRC 107566]
MTATTTSDIHEIIAALREITDLIEGQAANLSDLPGGVTVDVTLDTVRGNDDDAQRAIVDLVAQHLTGQPAELSSSGVHLASLITELRRGCWSMRALGFVQIPDPAAELRAENRRLRAELAAARATR